MERARRAATGPTRHRATARQIPAGPRLVQGPPVTATAPELAGRQVTVTAPAGRATGQGLRITGQTALYLLTAGQLTCIGTIHICLTIGGNTGSL